MQPFLIHPRAMAHAVHLIGRDCRRMRRVGRRQRVKCSTHVFIYDLTFSWPALRPFSCGNSL